MSLVEQETKLEVVTMGDTPINIYNDELGMNIEIPKSKGCLNYEIIKYTVDKTRDNAEAMLNHAKKLSFSLIKGEAPVIQIDKIVLDFSNANDLVFSEFMIEVQNFIMTAI